MKGPKLLLAALLAAACVGLAAWMLTSIGVDSRTPVMARTPTLETAFRDPAHERLDGPEESGRPHADARAALEEAKAPIDAASSIKVDSKSGWIPGSIAGRIKTDTEIPIADVQVILQRNSDRSTAWAHRVRTATVLADPRDGVLDVVSTSDERGAYRFENVDPGKYTVRLFNRTPENRTVIAGSNPPTSAPAPPVPIWTRDLVLDPGVARDNVDFVLESASTIAGRVLDLDGRGVQNAEVSVARTLRTQDRAMTRDGSRPRATPLPVRTGMQGSFCLSGLARGDYVLHAEPPRSSGADARSLELSGTDSLPLATGTFDARIFLSRLTEVSGVVRAPDGSAWAHAGVIAKDVDGREVGVAYADADGRFSIAVAEEMVVDLVACVSRPLGEGRTGLSMDERAAGPALRAVRAGNKSVVLELPKAR